MVAIPKLSFYILLCCILCLVKFVSFFHQKEKAFTESGKYVYALLSLETNLLICGKIFFEIKHIKWR